MTEVLFTDPASNQFKNFEKKTQNMIILRLKKLREQPDRYLKPLRKYSYFSLRIGNYRAIIDWRKNKDQIWIVAIGHRKNIYQKEL